MYFFTFSTEKVGIVGAFSEKKEKSRNTFKKVGKVGKK